jgi:hypothetical protein
MMDLPLAFKDDGSGWFFKDGGSGLVFRDGGSGWFFKDDGSGLVFRMPGHWVFRYGLKTGLTVWVFKVRIWICWTGFSRSGFDTGFGRWFFGIGHCCFADTKV